MSHPLKDKKSELADYIKKAVLTLSLPPGLSVDETQLSEMFALSRTPIREVLRQLAGEGYVELKENRGIRVSDLSHVTLRNFFLAAPMVYGAILRLAAENARPKHIDQLKHAQADFCQAISAGTVADQALANNRFHDITGVMANNIYLLPSFRRLLIDHARIAMTFYQSDNRENLRESARHHDQMIAAIEARDSALAAELADIHWALSRGQIEDFVTPSSLSFTLGEYPEQQRAN